MSHALWSTDKGNATVTSVGLWTAFQFVAEIFQLQYCFKFNESMLIQTS